MHVRGAQAYHSWLCLGSGLVALGVFLLSGTPPAGAAPGVMTIVQHMKDIFEPALPRVGNVKITVSGRDGKTRQWTGRQARKMFPNGKRTLLVLQTPDYLSGTALLVGERDTQLDMMGIYLPTVDRVRQITPVETYQRFLESDLSYADLGFVSRQGRYQLLGEEALPGSGSTGDDGNDGNDSQQTYKLEFVPIETIYYSRILTWVDTHTFLPLRRDYYDVAGKVWKTQTFEQVEMVNDMPTPLSIVMRDVQNGTHTQFQMEHVQYTAEIPDTLFDPAQLPVAAQRLGLIGLSKAFSAFSTFPHTPQPASPKLLKTFLSGAPHSRPATVAVYLGKA